MTDAEDAYGDIVVRVRPRRSAAASLLVPLDHRLGPGGRLLWIGSAADCELTVPDLRPHQLVVRRVAAEAVAIQDQSGGGIRYQALGRDHPTVSKKVVVRVGECVTLARYHIEIRLP